MRLYFEIAHKGLDGKLQGLRATRRGQAETTWNPKSTVTFKATPHIASLSMVAQERDKVIPVLARYAENGASRADNVTIALVGVKVKAKD